MHVALQFVVEHNAEGPAAGACDPFGFPLVEPIERSVVLGFARFYKSVIDRLAFGQTARLQDEALGLFRENEEAFLFLVQHS